MKSYFNMKKTVLTNLWLAGAKMFALFLLFVISMDVVAQATSNYLISIKVRNLSWNYPGADPALAPEGDFGFVVGGQFYSLPEDFGPNSGNYVADYNLGVSLNDIVWTGVVPVGASLAAPTANVIFQAYENDCGDLMSFDTGFLDCGLNEDDSNVDVILFIDWASYVTLDADGQYVPGSYNIPFGELGPYNGGDGSSYDVALQVTVVAVEPPLESCDLDAFPAGGGVVYECLSETEGQTSIIIADGTAPYKIIGSGIYNAVTGNPFDFGVDPFGLEVPAGNFEFQVREGQPWTVTVIDATGCIVAQEGVMDLPNPDFNVPSPLCTTDPTVELYEYNCAYVPPFAPLNGTFFGDAGVNDNGDNCSATYDPFEAGPGVHLVAYCVEPVAGGGNGYGPGFYEEGCGICHTETIYVYPSFDGYDATGNLIVDMGLQTGGTPQADAPLQVSYCLGHGDVTLGLTNYNNIAALFATLEPEFDADGLIDEDDFFITWSGPGITDNPDGTATLAFGWGANEMPLGAHAIQVTVGYPNCPTDKVVIVNVLPNFDATINNLATCSTEGEMFDLTGLFGASTTAGGYFYQVGAGGALTAIPSGMIPNGDGTSVNILYSNTPDLTNVSQCNADDCINCDQATVTFSGFTVDASFAVAGGPEICRGSSPLVDTVVDPLVSEGQTSGAQASVGGSGLPATLTSTANLGIIDPYGHINSLEITLHYDGIAGNTQGDHDGWTVTLPGGVTFSEADGAGANGDNLFDRTITWAEIQAAYADAGLNIDDVYTGTNAPDLVGTCQPNDFEFELVTTSANSAISIDVDYRYVEPAGFVTAYIWSTGTQLPAEAISFDTETGEYYLNTLFTDADGNEWDLSTYLDIRVVHTTYSCDAQLPDGTLCTQSAEEIIKVLPALNATIADFTACANAGAIDLEQMFIAGTTSQGGTFSSSGGTLNGNYLTAGEGTYTITYTIGAGTGNDGCDPVPGTATLTVEAATDPEFDYPTTVCVGSIPALPAAASGTTSGLQVFDPQGNNISHEDFVAATVGGLYTITQTTGPVGCQDEYTHEVLVVESPTAVSADATVCRSQAVVDLTQFVAGSTMGGNFSGTGVAGNVLVLGTLSSSTITYTVGSNGCTATTTFTLTIVDQPNAAFDVIDQICTGTTVNLYDYTLQDGGSFTDNGVDVATPAAYTFTGEGLHNLVYTINGGSNCIDSDQENVYVIDQSTVTAEYGFVCQSGDDGDFEIDLSQQLTDGSNSANGGTFTMNVVPPFISEIEYTGGPQIDARDFIEVTGPAGLNLANYVLVFYKRMDYTNNNTFDDAVNSGAVYGVIDFADLQPNQTVGATADNGTIIDAEVTGLNGLAYGSVGVKYFDATDFDATASNPGNDVAPIGSTIQGIADGPAAVALVNKGETTKLRDLDRILGNDDVVQFIGYGTSMTNTNAGIFSACDGPARSLVPADINTVDGSDRSSQFTNICWVNPNIDDPEVAYATAPVQNVTSTGAGIPNYATVGDLTSAGSMNVGLRGDTPAEGYLAGRGHADELYFEYIAPNGDILDLDRLCHVLFTGGQIINTADYVNVENGDTNGDGTSNNNDDDEVEFTCETMTYTLPFGYQLLPGGPGTTQCGSNQAIFYLTILMDGEENWNNYSIDNPEGTLKTAVCDYSTTNLNTLIDDEVHWIAPIKAEGSVDESETFTFEENVKDPLITELKYKSYADGCSFTAADDHCVLYNYVDDNNTPFNGTDDQYTNLQFCDGIEISAPVGTELSCYALVFYNNNDLLPQTSANGAAFDVTYIAANGLPATTKVSNGRYMQLYGLVDDDSNNGYPGGTIMTVPTWGLDAWNNYPYYAGANPYDASNAYGQANAPGEAGLYIDTNENGAYDLNDYAIEGPTGFEMYDGASFPWERGTECEKEDVGARWFPIIDVPGNGLEEIGAVGLINTCTGKLVDFISWGGDICVETKEDCSCAGPFEQLSSAQIDTFQNASCCDLRTLQLISASVAAELTGSSCPLDVADANGNVWVQVWNGGEYTIPGCGIYTADAEEFYQFSNSIGYYNCDLLEEAVSPDAPEEFTLDLSDLDISDNYIVSNHVIEVTIGSQEENYFQLYTYNISTGACGNLNSNDGDPGNVNIIPSNTPAANNGVDLDENGNTNLITTVPGMSCGVPTHDNSVISDQAVGANGLLNSLEQAWDTNPNTINNLGSSYAYWDYDNPGVVNYLPGHNPANDNNPWSNGLQPSPIYMGTTIDNYGYPIYNGWGDDTPCMACSTDPNACIGDGEYAPAMYNASGSHTYNGSYDAQGNPVGPHALTFDFENGQGPLNIEGGCFDSFCTSLAKTTYTVGDLTAYLYNGNNIPGYEDGTIDSCRTLVHTRDHVTVTIRVKFDYHQCLPAGNFAGSDVNLNFDVNDPETYDMPYWTFEPNGLADISPVAITYNVTNAHPIEDDDATDDLACLDDDNDNVRTQDIEVLPSADASLSQSSISVCTNSPNVNLNQYVSGTPGGTWSGTGVNNNSFDPTTAGTFTATYSVEGCSEGASTATLTITVEQVGSVNLSGLTTSACSNDPIALPAGATWSGDGVSGSTFTPAGPGSYVLSYAAGSGDCGVSGTHTINVYAPLAVSTSEGEGNGPNSRSVTLTISGGLAPYTVNGMAIGGNTYTASLPCDAPYNFVVGSAASSCGTIPVFGQTAPCAPECTAEAGQLFLVSGTIGSGSNVNSCANGTIVVNAAGFNGDAVQTYAATDANGTVIALSSTGVFNLTNASGEVTFWGVNFCPGTNVPNTVSGIQAAIGESLQITNGITVNIAPAIVVTLTAECDPASGGYFVRMTVSGGDPTLNGFGSYISNCASTIISGNLIIEPGETSTTAVLAADASGTPFPAGSSFSCSVGDGSLCEAAASIQMPATACGNNAANPNSGFTLADTPVDINVLGNDDGIVAVTSVTNPAHGTAIINPNGTITYTPDPGFSGTDNFVYQGVDALGNTYTTNVTVVVQASSTALLATWDRDCTPVNAGDNEYVVTVYVQGGTAPYTVSGSYNGILTTAGPVSFSVLDGNGFQVVVTDNAGNQFPIDQSDIIACSKVAVDLLSFDGEVKTEGNYLTWATATETDNDYFTLEASRDGVNFEVINITDGAGNSNVAHNYNFMHKEAQNGVTYYRLSTTDFNGQIVHHDVITLTRGEVKFGIVELFPVPAVVDLSIKFTTAGAGAVKANIYSVSGQLVATKDVAAIKGMNTIKLDVANFAAGTYYVTLNDGNNVVTTKFVKQ